MTTMEGERGDFSGVLLRVDLEYTAAALEDWGLDESAIAEIHRRVGAEFERGKVDDLIVGIITDAADEWLEATRGAESADEGSA